MVEKLKNYTAKTMTMTAYKAISSGDPMKDAVDHVANNAASYCQNQRVYTGDVLCSDC